MSLSTRSVVDSLDVNVNAMLASLVVEPEVTPLVLEAMVIVGAVASCVKANGVAAAALALPAESVALPTLTSRVIASSSSVGVIVYT